MAAGAVSSILNIQKNNENADKAKKAAYDAYNRSLNQYQNVANQVTSRGTLEDMERSRQGLKERAMIATSGGEYGVTGNTLARMMNVASVQESIDKGIIATNTENALGQVRNEAASEWYRTDAAMQDAENSKIGFLDGLLMTIGGASKGYQSGQGLSGALGSGGSNLAGLLSNGSSIVPAGVTPMIPLTKRTRQPIEKVLF